MPIKSDGLKLSMDLKVARFVADLAYRLAIATKVVALARSRKII